MDRAGTALRRSAAALAVLAALALIGGCAPGKPKEPAGLGRRVFGGAVRALYPSPDGAALAFLDGCVEVKAQFLPPQTARCDLQVAPAAGGASVRIAAGVTTLPHGVAWSPDGKALLALADYDHASASGTLVLWRDGAARPIAEAVTFHGFGAHGEIGLVAAGKLAVMLPGESTPRAVAGAEGVASFEFSPLEYRGCGGRGDGDPHVRLLVRRAYGAGGQLLGAGCEMKQARPLERAPVGEYGFDRANASFAYTVQGKDGAALRLVPAPESAPARALVTHDLGRGVQSFAFAPAGSAVAFVADVIPGKQGNLHVRGPDRKDVVLAREVGEFRWARAAPRLAWLERYDARVRAGVLGAGGPDGEPRAFAAKVSEFDLSPDGRQVAFLQHTTRGGYSVDLGVARVDGAKGDKPVTVAQGVFGFAFSPDGRWLYYRTRCVRNAEACDLERVPAGGAGAAGKPEPIASGVKSFEFDPNDPGRLLLGWQRMDMVALDLGVWKDGTLTRVDSAALPGSARFLGPDSGRIAYVVVHPKRAGVYVAEVPR